MNAANPNANRPDPQPPTPASPTTASPTPASPTPDRPTTERPESGTSRAGKTLRKLARLAVIATLTYTCCCALLYFSQRSFIYFPEHQEGPTPDTLGLDYEDVTISTEDDVRIHGWFVPAHDAQGQVLFLHGNAGNISDRLGTIGCLHDLGLDVLIIDYRGYGRSSGQPDERGLQRDARAAWEYLQHTGRADPHTTVIIGRSLGGAVAVRLAADVNPAALVLESTFTRLEDVARRHYPFLPISLLLRDRFDSLAWIDQVKCPILVLHGRDDRLIPVNQGRELCDAAGPRCRMIETPGGHNDAGFLRSREFTLILRDFIARALPE